MTGRSKAVQEGGEAGAVSGDEETAHGRPFGEEAGGGEDVVSRALDGLEGAGAREAEPGQGLLVGETIEEADGGDGEAGHGQQHQTGVEADQQGAETDPAHLISPPHRTAA